MHSNSTCISPCGCASKRHWVHSLYICDEPISLPATANLSNSTSTRRIPRQLFFKANHLDPFVCVCACVCLCVCNHFLGVGVLSFTVCVSGCYSNFQLARFSILQQFSLADLCLSKLFGSFLSSHSLSVCLIPLYK